MRQRVPLLIVNYTLDKEHPLLGHQIGLVESIGRKLRPIIVISTNSVLPFQSPSVTSFGVPASRHRLWKIALFLKIYILIILRYRPKNILFHMNPTYAVLGSWVGRLFGAQIFLWYTHKSLTLSTRVAVAACNKVLTASLDSVNITSKKIVATGHHIDTSRLATFPYTLDFKSAVVLGRISPSKNIHEILKCVYSLKDKWHLSNLDLIGPISDHEYHSALINFCLEFNIKNVSFQGALPQSSWTTLICKYGLALHASQGSLDKSPLELTWMGIPVVSSNQSFINIFGSWSDDGFKSLNDEVQALFAKNPTELLVELDRRRVIVSKDHSMSAWTSTFLRLLN